MRADCYNLAQNVCVYIYIYNNVNLIMQIKYSRLLQLRLTFSDPIFCLFVCLFLAQQPTMGQGFLIHEVSR
jgi:hypothetical protein